MSKKEFRKLLKQKDAKVKVTGVAVLMIAVALSSVFILLPQDNIVKAASTSDFPNYITITIDHTQVPSTLSNFAVLVYNASCTALDGLTDDDFTFFGSDNATECNWELENWTDDTDTLVAWVNITSISSSADTTFYLYYESSAAGNNGGENNASSAWDSDYIHIWHMDGSSPEPNSVGLGNGTITGADIVAGKVGSARYFNETNQDYIDYGDLTQPGDGLLDVATFEAWLNVPTGCEGSVINKHHKDGSNFNYSYLFLTRPGGPLRITLYGTGTGNYWSYTTDANISFDTWVYTVATVHMADETAMFYVNGSSSSATKTHDVGTGPTAFRDITNTERSGMSRSSTPGYRTNSIDELRISKIERSADWLNTCYNSMQNSSDGGFCTWGAIGESSVASTFTLSGYNATDFITWTGEGGDTVWNNATGDQTLEVNYNVNATTNLTDICINMDADDMDAGFSDENITVYVSFDNSTFAVLNDDIGNGAGVCANGLNLTINATTWPASNPGGNPNFPIDPDGTWENDTIYLRFTLAIPSGMSVSTYSSVNTDWSVDWKYTT